MGNTCTSCCAGGGCPPWLGGGGAPLKNLPSEHGDVERPKPEGPSHTDDADFLSIKGWDWEFCRNGEEHHTASYTLMAAAIGDSSPSTAASNSRATEGEGAGEGKPEEDRRRLVVRRGAAFHLTLATNVAYNHDKHKISLMFFVADCQENFGNGTQVGVLVGAEEDAGGWWAKVHARTDSSVTLEVRSSPLAVVGRWRLEVDVASEGGVARCFAPPQRFFLLFNPWCPEDSVYLDDKDERREFVLADSGLIWRGTHNRLRPCPWHFGQFEENVLECVLYVLNSLCQIVPAHRADPIRVVRAISAGVNSPDDSGVLVGNWTGEYKGGRRPTDWRDSPAILQQYLAKKKPVKYGQCWVFSGVVTTACRALGLPCRPITNFLSAHDTHNSLTIDRFYGDDGEDIESLNTDSVWNFHVWNEVWMRRPDLGDDYHGWQVIDATPQEQSDGEFRCGPTSLVAVKRGQIQFPYDGPFVYAEVNADTLFWKYQGKRQPMKLLGRKTGGVGVNISTKAVGKMRRDDVTYLYKHKEESEEERSVMVSALRRCENSFARYYINQKLEDVQLELHLRDDITIGKPFTVSLSLENKSSEKEHSVRVVLRADAMLYTGRIKDNVKTHEANVSAKPNSKQTVEMVVNFDDYYKKLADQCAFNISCLGKVKETNFEYFAQDDFRVRKPDIKIKCLSGEKVFVGAPSRWSASFSNPLPFALTKARFYILPPNSKSIFIKLKKKVEVGADASVDFEVTPRKEGDMTMSVMFSSKELEDVDGFVTQKVSEPEPEPEPPTADEAPIAVEEKEEEEKDEEEDKEKEEEKEKSEKLNEEDEKDEN